MTQSLILFLTNKEIMLGLNHSLMLLMKLSGLKLHQSKTITLEKLNYQDQVLIKKIQEEYLTNFNHHIIKDKFKI